MHAAEQAAGNPLGADPAATKTINRPIYSKRSKDLEPQVKEALEGIALDTINRYLALSAGDEPPEGNKNSGNGTPNDEKNPSGAAKKLADYRKILNSRPSRRGMFVSIFNRKNRRLVGCMGAVYPVKENLLSEIEHWSRVALLHDPRRFNGTDGNASNDAKTKNRKTKRADRRLLNRVQSRRRIAVIISLIDDVTPVAHFNRVNSLSEGLMVRYQGREALVLPGEARTAAYALKMVQDKLDLPKNSDIRLSDMEFFRVRALRFGGAKVLFNEKSGKFKGYGG